MLWHHLGVDNSRKIDQDEGPFQECSFSLRLYDLYYAGSKDKIEVISRGRSTRSVTLSVKPVLHEWERKKK